MGDNWGTAGGGGGYSSVNLVILVTHCRNPPRVDDKMLLKEEAHNFLRAYDTYCCRTEDGRAAGVQCKLYKMSVLLSYSQKNAISLFYFDSRGLIEEMLAECVREIAGVAESNAEVDLGQLEHEITRKFKLSLDLRVCKQAFAVQLKVQEFLHDRKILRGVCAKRSVGERIGCHRGEGDFIGSDATRFLLRRASSCAVRGREK